MKQQIYFNEVVTRDGFQMEPEFVPTDEKVALINALSQCGYAKIEVTSFTSAKAIPMLRDAEEVMGRIERVLGVEYTVLVPNLRGAERAMESRPDEFNLVMSTSETHNLANLRMPREHSFAALREVIDRYGTQVPINVSLSACFGCPMEGDVPQAEVMQWAQRFADLGVRGLTICDTTGMAHPEQVAQMCDALRVRFPSRCTFTTRGAWAWLMCWLPRKRALTVLMARWAVWAAVLTRRVQAATSAAKTRSTCWMPWVTTQASIRAACCPLRVSCPSLLAMLFLARSPRAAASLTCTLRHLLWPN
jgi:hypothetical protein